MLPETLTMPARQWAYERDAEALCQRLDSMTQIERELFLGARRPSSMENIDLKVEGTTLIVKIDLKHRGEKSSTGKTIRVASTEGNVEVPGHPNVKIGINAYTK